MKTKLKQFSKRTISIVLALVMLVSMAVVGMVSVSANGVKAGNNVYYINTNNWTSVYMHFWENSGNQYEQMTNISGTGIYVIYSNNDIAHNFPLIRLALANHLSASTKKKHAPSRSVSFLSWSASFI